MCRFYKNVTFGLFIISLSVLPLGCSLQVQRNSPKITGDPDAIVIVEKIKRNANNLKSFRAEVTAYRNEEGKWFEVLNQKIVAKLPYKVKIDRNALRKSDYGYGRKIIVTDGTVVWSYRVDDNEVVIWRGPHLLEVMSNLSFSPSNMVPFLYYSLSFATLGSYFDTDLEVSLLSTTEIEGRKAFVVKIYPVRKNQVSWLKLWVDVERYIPLKAERHMKKPVSKRIQMNVEFKDYTLINGIWLFQETQGTLADLGIIDTKTWKTYDQVKVIWKDLQINPDIPDSTFKFKIPKGAKVIKTKTR